MPSSASNLTNAKRVEFRTRMLIGQMTAVGRLGLPAIFAVGPFLLLNRTFSPHRQGLKSARKRHMHRSKQHYSITSSARARSLSGMSRLSVFAIFRLITSSNLVGRRTGRSEGLSPFRIRPT